MKGIFIMVFFMIYASREIESKPFFRSASKDIKESNVADLRKSNSELNEEQTNNEATPGFIQKKIAKILRKIQFFSSLSNGFGSASSTEKPEVDLDFEDFDKAFTTTVNPLEIGEPFPETPEREELEEENGNRRGFKYEPSPVGFGIYFSEILGSLFGLAYGAALQVANVTRPRV